MNRLPIVFMFSGQGSQHYQMARELFEQQPIFRDYLIDLDRVVRAVIGTSVVDVLYDRRKSRADAFDHILHTHPAILMVELALAKTLMAHDVKPDYVLGASLGSYAAAVIAECLSAEEALKTVAANATLLDAICPRGAMVAVLAHAALQETDPVLHGFEIAAISSPRHFVLACDERSIDVVEQRLRRLDVSHQRLPVAYAFHSRLIEPIKDALVACGNAVPMRAPKLPLVCCAAGDVLDALPEDYFWSVARRPIRFDRAVEAMELRGPCQYIDLGPSGSLGGMLKNILHRTSRSTVEITLGYFENDLRNVEAVIARDRPSTEFFNR